MRLFITYLPYLNESKKNLNLCCKIFLRSPRGRSCPGLPSWQAGRQQEPPLLTRLLKRCLRVSVGAPPRAGTGCDFTHTTAAAATIVSRDPRHPPPRAAHPSRGDGAAPGVMLLAGAHVMLG